MMNVEPHNTILQGNSKRRTSNAGLSANLTGVPQFSDNDSVLDTSGFTFPVPEASVVGGGRGPRSGSIADTANTAGSTLLDYYKLSTLAKLEERFFMFLLNLQIKEEATSRKDFFLALVTNMYIMWVTLFVGFFSDYNYGEYGVWIAQALNYPITFGFHHLPYTAALIIACILFSVLMVGVLNLLLAYRSVYTMSKHWPKIKVITRILLGVVCYLSMPFLWLFLGFLDCSYQSSVMLPSHSTEVQVLYRFPDVACYGTTNIAMMVISIISVVTIFCMVFLGMYTLNNSNPRSSLPFLSFNQHGHYLNLLSLNVLFLIMNLVSHNYMIAPALLYLLCRVGLALLFAYRLPFYKRWENALYFGFEMATVGVGICGIISLYVNSFDEWGFGLGLLGMTFGTSICFFIIGWVVLEIYTRYILRDIRTVFYDQLEYGLNQLNNDADVVNTKTVLEKESIKILQIIDETNRNRRLYHFLKFSVKQQAQEDEVIGSIRDLDMVTCFLKGVSTQKSYQNVELLIMAAVVTGSFLGMDINSNTKSLALLRKAKKGHPSLLQRFEIAERTKEVEANSDNERGLLEIKHILHTLEKKEFTLQTLHKAFWKNLLNESVSIGKILSINKQITSLTEECKVTLNGLMANYGNNKTVLRRNAKFLQSFLFEKERADELYEEAAAIEEEESKKYSSSRRKSKAGRYQNKVLPNEGINSAAIRNNNYEEMSYVGDLASNYGRYNNNRALDEESNFDGIENVNDGLQKKEVQFRNALNRQTSHSSLLVFFLALSLLSIVVVSIGFGLSISFAQIMTSSIDLSYDICIPTALPRLFLREIRTQQNFLHLFPQYSHEIRSTGLPNVNSTEEFHKSHVHRMRKYSNVLGNLKLIAATRFSESLIQDFTNTDYYLFTPVIYNDNNSTNPQEYVQYRKSSISEITDQLIFYTQNFLTYTIHDYNRTTDSADFLFYWSNRINQSAAYDAYCSQFSNRNQVIVNTSSNQFLAFYATAISIYVTCSVIVVVISLIHLKSLRSTIKFLTKNLPHDVAGKIFSQLEKKSDEEIDVKEMSFISKPETSIVIAVLITIAVTVLCITLMFAEMNLNSSASETAIRHITYGVHILRTANNIAFRLSEMFSFLRYPYKFYLNDDRLMTKKELDDFHVQHKELTGIIADAWNELYYRNAFRMYDELAAILVPSNCTYPNITTQYSCLPMSDLIVKLISSANRFGEDLYYSNYQLIDLFTGLLKHYEMTSVLMDRMVTLFSLYTKLSSRPSFSITITFSLFGYLSVLGMTYFAYSLLTDFWRQKQQLRIMLNYVPVDDLEENEELKNFALFDELPSQLKFSRAKTDDKGDGKIRSILNSAVDGAILCNHKGDIELFNPTAQNMFGMNNSDVLGQPLLKLFDPSDTENYQKLSQIIQKTITNAQPMGETLEIGCLRKNQSKFPAKVNIVASIYNKKPLISCFIRDFTPEKKQNLLLAEEKKKSETLLLNIMPEAVASRLKSGETFIAEKFNDVTVFFSDMVGFTRISSGMNPSELVYMLNTIVNGFDLLTEKYTLEKIKTIGDAYFCVGGINGNTQSDHPDRTLKFAIETMAVIRDYNLNGKTNVNIRVGIHTGPVIAGVIGIKKFAYDLWGDTINTASRMESTGIPGRIQISRQTYERVHDLGFQFEERKIDVKGKGLCQTYLLKPKHHVNPLDMQYDDATPTLISSSSFGEMPPPSSSPTHAASSSSPTNQAQLQPAASFTSENVTTNQVTETTTNNGTLEQRPLRPLKRILRQDVNNESRSALGFLSENKSLTSLDESVTLPSSSTDQKN